MKDIYSSLKRAKIKQEWLFGDKAIRLGSPFEWTDALHKSTISELRDLIAVRFFFSMFYVKRPMPDHIMLDEYEKINEYCLEQLTNAFQHFFPFLPISQSWKNNIESQALIRCQDYCFIRKYCKDLRVPLTHLDIGPGLGSSAIYSLKYFDSIFYGLEVSPMSYSVQRKFFSFISPYPGAYLDVIECENFQISEADIIRLVNENPNYKIKHVPTWHSPWISSKSIDLITATFMLNETNHAGVLWLLSEASRVLRTEGYFYIRDSFILKPGLHDINYDKVLLEMGFEKKAQLEFTDRHEFYGIPRLFQKKTAKSFSFEELSEMCLGKFAVVAPGNQYSYNRPLKTEQPIT